MNQLHALLAFISVSTSVASSTIAEGEAELAVSDLLQLLHVPFVVLFLFATLVLVLGSVAFCVYFVVFRNSRNDAAKAEENMVMMEEKFKPILTNHFYEANV